MTSRYGSLINIKYGLSVIVFVFEVFGLQFFSVTLVHFSDQNWNSQSYFDLHIIVSLVHIKKAVSHFFEQVANALVHPCKWLCTILCCLQHYQLLMSYWSKCIIMAVCSIVSLPQHLTLVHRISLYMQHGRTSCHNMPSIFSIYYH